MEVTVNGRARRIDPGSTIADLIDALGLRREHVAVERNREIVPRDRHASTVVGEGDQLEIVTFVGGG